MFKNFKLLFLLLAIFCSAQNCLALYSDSPSGDPHTYDFKPGESANLAKAIDQVDATGKQITAVEIPVSGALKGVCMISVFSNGSYSLYFCNLATGAVTGPIEPTQYDVYRDGGSTYWQASYGGVVFNYSYTARKDKGGSVSSADGTVNSTTSRIALEKSSR